MRNEASILMIYDITRTITPTLAVWPGDTPFSFEQPVTMGEGVPINLTTLTMSAHTGTHADAPYHFQVEGAHPAELPLDRYIGPAQVVTLPRRHGGVVPEDFAGVDISAKRLLLKTWVSELADDVWPDDFPYPTPALIDWLPAGLKLFGVDMPSVDDFNSKTLTCHHQLAARGIAHLETLQLKGVPDGLYELIALPLKVDGVCGSPVRAILRTI